ncbi:hypothetical protein AHAS_Ahas17G0237900 [Arachis hypogaea]
MNPLNLKNLLRMNLKVICRWFFFFQAPATHRYKIFISFRGKDTRKGFFSHLHVALRESQIETFRDDDNMETGRVVWDELVDAIRNSKLFVVIFSENYASSWWCLRELVEIMECKNRNEHVFMIPMFYEIEPTHVRKQTRTYRTIFAKHEGFTKDLAKSHFSTQTKKKE